jgi:hypothetical protein
MEFNIKGIEFNVEDLGPCELDSLVTGEISTQHLFYVTSSNKPFLLLRAGELITGDFIEKYRDKGLTKVYGLSVVIDEIVEKYMGFLKALQHSKHYFDQLKVKDAILLSFYRDFLDPEREISLMNFIYPAFKVFNRIPIETILNIQNCHYTLMSRALSVAALSIPTSLINGLLDSEMVSDIYQNAILMDMGLVSEQTNYLVFQACEKERTLPGSGKEFLLSQPLGAGDVDLFESHPEASYEIVQTMTEFFHNPEMIEGIRYQHEKYDGTGFARGISYSSISSWETVLIFCDYLVPFEEQILNRKDVQTGIHKWFKDLESNERLKTLPILKLLGKWNGLKKWASEHQGNLMLEEMAV